MTGTRRQTWIVFGVWILIGFAMGHRAWAVEYRVPLPERTYSGEWKFTLEVISQNGLPNSVQVSGYDAYGDQMLATEPTGLWSGRVFRYVLAGADPNRVQSLVVTAELPLHGFLWMEHEHAGQINGVTLEKPMASRLILPHIPRNYFKWKVSFAAMGVDQGVGSSDIVFAYFNDVDAQHYDVPVREDLENFGYLRRTPNHDFLTVGLGTESAASWGLLETATDHFGLTGYQTFARLDDSLQTCAMELLDEGMAEGVVVFSPWQDDGLGYDDYFVFVNPNDVTVDVDFSLVGRVTQEELSRVETFLQTITIEPNQKRVSVFGMDLFPDFEGEPRSLCFSARPAQGDATAPQSLPIFAIHLQSEWQDQALGGHWFAEIGTHLQTWMTYDPNWRTVLELANLGDESTTLVVTLTHEGQSRVIGLDMNRGEVVSLTHEDIAELMDESLETLARSCVLVTARTSAILSEETVDQGRIAGKMMVFSGQDLAIVNPIVGPDLD